MDTAEIIRQTETSRAAILRSLAVGDNPFKILLIAVDCISKLSSDMDFAEQCRRNIPAVYCAGLSDPQAVQLRMSELEERITRVRSSVWKAADADTRERLIFSVRQMQGEYKRLSYILPSKGV